MDKLLAPSWPHWCGNTAETELHRAVWRHERVENAFLMLFQDTYGLKR